MADISIESDEANVGLGLEAAQAVDASAHALGYVLKFPLSHVERFRRAIRPVLRLPLPQVVVLVEPSGLRNTP